MSALALTVIATAFLAIHFASPSPQNDGLSLRLSSLLVFPLVALPLLPDLLAP
jgi:hypothetical protein